MGVYGRRIPFAFVCGRGRRGCDSISRRRSGRGKRRGSFRARRVRRCCGARSDVGYVRRGRRHQPRSSDSRGHAFGKRPAKRQVPLGTWSKRLGVEDDVHAAGEGRTDRGRGSRQHGGGVSCHRCGTAGVRWRRRADAALQSARARAEVAIGRGSSAGTAHRSRRTTRCTSGSARRGRPECVDERPLARTGLTTSCCGLTGGSSDGPRWRASSATVRVATRGRTGSFARMAASCTKCSPTRRPAFRSR